MGDLILVACRARPYLAHVVPAEVETFRGDSSWAKCLDQPWRLRILARLIIFVQLNLALCSQTPRRFRIYSSLPCHNCNGLSISVSHQSKFGSRTPVAVSKPTIISGRGVLPQEIVTKSVREIGRWP